MKFYRCLRFLIFGSCLFNALSAETTLKVGFGWRQDQLDWNIAAPDNDPNILSELEWKDIRMWQISGKFASSFLCDWYLKLRGDYAKVYDGKNIDSDYAGNNRTQLFLRSENNASKGEAFDFSIGIGYPLNYWGDTFCIIPLIGYAHYEQHFTLHDGFQTVNLINGLVGPFPGLDSHYHSRWMSAWFGLDLSIPFACDDGLLFATGEIYTSSFKGSGRWNLRRDLVGDFEHNCNGWGFLLLGGGEYRIWNNLFLGAQITYIWMKATNGTDTTQFVVPITDPFDNIIGEQVVEGKTRLNSVRWQSLRIEATLCYEF